MLRICMMSALALAAGLCSAGCGTMANFDTEGRRKAGVQQAPTAFGGVSRDFKWAAETMSVDCPLPNKVLIGWPRSTLYMVDVPFSLLGDLVTLPMIYMSEAEDSAAIQTGDPPVLLPRDVLPVGPAKPGAASH